MLFQRQLRKITKQSRPVWIEEQVKPTKIRCQSRSSSRSKTLAPKQINSNLYIPKLTAETCKAKSKSQSSTLINRRILLQEKTKTRAVSRSKNRSQSNRFFLAKSPAAPPRKSNFIEDFKNILGIVDSRDINDEKVDYHKLYFKNKRKLQVAKCDSSQKNIDPIQETPVQTNSNDEDQYKSSFSSLAFSHKGESRKLSSEQIRSKFKRSLLMVSNFSNFMRTSKLQAPQFPNFSHQRGSIGREQRHRHYLSSFGHNYVLKTRFILMYQHKSEHCSAWFKQTRIIFKHEIDATTLKIQLRYIANGKPEKITLNNASEEIIGLCQQLQKLTFTDIQKLDTILLNYIRDDDSREEQSLQQFLRNQINKSLNMKNQIINKFNKDIRKLYTHQSQKVSRIAGVQNGALQTNSKSRTFYWFSQDNLDHEYVFKQAMAFIIKDTAIFIYRTLPTCSHPPRNLLMKKITTPYRRCSNGFTDKVNLLACLSFKLTEQYRLRQVISEYDIVIEKDKFEISKVLFDGADNMFVDTVQPRLYFHQNSHKKLFKLHNQYTYSFFKIKSCQSYRLGRLNVVIKGTNIKVYEGYTVKFLNLDDWEDEWTYQRLLILKFLNYSNRQLMKRFVLLFTSQVKHPSLVGQTIQQGQIFKHLKQIEGKKYSIITTINWISKTIQCRFISLYSRLVRYQYKWSLVNLEWSLNYIKNQKLMYFSQQMSLETKLGLIYDKLVRDPSYTYSHLRLPFSPVPQRLVFGRKTAYDKVSPKFCTRLKPNTYTICCYINNNISKVHYFQIYNQKSQKNFSRSSEESQMRDTEGLLEEMQSEFSTKKLLMRSNDTPVNFPSFKRKKLVRRQGIRNGSIRSSMTAFDQRIKQNCVWRHVRIGNENYFIIANVNRPLIAEIDTDSTELEIQISRSKSVTIFKWTGSLADVLRNTLRRQNLGKKMICTRRSVSMIAERLIRIIKQGSGCVFNCHWGLMQFLEDDRAQIQPKKCKMYLAGQVLSITIKQPVQICLLNRWEVGKDLTRNRTLVDITSMIKPGQTNNKTQSRLFRRLYNRVKWYKQIGHI